MHKKFLTGLIYSLTLNLGVKALWILVVEVAVQRTVGTVAYGAYFVAFNFAFLPLILLDLGLTQFNTRHIAMNRQLVGKYLPKMLPVKLLLGVIYFVFMLSLGYLTGFRGKEFALLLLVGGIQFLTSFNQYLRSNLSALLLFRLDAVLAVLDRLLLMTGVSLVIFTGWTNLDFSVWHYVWFQLGALSVVFVFGLAANLYYAGLHLPKIRKAFYISVLRQILPFALLTLLMSGYLRFDAVLLKWLLPEGYLDSGVYAAAFRLFDGFSQVAILFSGILLPVFSGMLKQKQDISSIMNVSASMLASMGVVLGVCGIFFSHELAAFLYKEEIDYTARVLRVYLCGSLPYALALLSGTLLTAAGKLRMLNIVAFSCLLLNLVLNFFLIPLLQAEGSAITAVATYTLSALLQLFFCYKILDYKISGNYFIRLILFAGCMAATAFTLQYMEITGIKAPLIVWVVALPSAWLSGAVPFRELWAMVKGRMG